MSRVKQAGPGHDPFNSAWARPVLLYFFILQKIVYTYVQFVFNIKNT
jgi:hypothetical protein